MPEVELSQTAQQWVNVTLLWVGFGTLAGLLARALLPGREPSGTVGTLLVGIVGAVIGPLAVSRLFHIADFNPIGPVGFLSAIGGAVVLLVGYRLVIAWLVLQQNEEEGES